VAGDFPDHYTWIDLQLGFAVEATAESGLNKARRHRETLLSINPLHKVIIHTREVLVDNLCFVIVIADME
jgi:hypothetical protein